MENKRILDMLRSPDLEMKNLGASIMKTELKLEEQINLLNKEIGYPYMYKVSTSDDGHLIFNIYRQSITYTSTASYYTGTCQIYNTNSIGTC